MPKTQSAIATAAPAAPGTGFIASVVIATHNRCANLKQCLASLQAMDAVEGNWEILVVDNNSTDATPQVVREFAASTEIPVRYWFEGRRGKSAALNTGIRHAQGTVVAFTDDDCLPDSQWLRHVLAEFDAHPDLAVLGGRVELYDQRDQSVSLVRCQRRTEIPYDRVMRALFGGPSDTDQYGSVIGANLSVRRSFFPGLGLFDLFLAPGSTNAPLAVEDSDFTYRACRAGLRVAFSPEPLVLHNHGRRTEAQAAATMVSYNRGRGAFYFKYCLAGDLRIVKAAYWELKGYSKSLCSRGVDPAKRKNMWGIIRAIFAGMRTQLAALGRERMGKLQAVK